MDLLVFRRVSTVVMSLLVAAFLAAIAVGGWYAESINPVMKSLAAAILVVGVILGAVRFWKFADVLGAVDKRGPVPVVVLVLFTGFIGGQGLEHTLLWVQPKISVTATDFSCSTPTRAPERCSGDYTVDGQKYFSTKLPVRSEPKDGRVEIEVLRADPDVVVTKGIRDILFWRLGGLGLLAATIVAVLRWLRLARAVTVELQRRQSGEVHSNGSNPTVR